MSDRNSPEDARDSGTAESGTLRRAAEWAQESVKAVAGAVAGGVVGGLVGIYSRYQAQAAVNVRPKLADVGLLDAFLTNHGVDWLYYHHPIPMIGFSVLFVGGIGFVIGVKA